MFKRLAIVIIGLLLASSGAAAQDQPHDERILLTFVPNVQFAPFYVGIEAGFFAEAGFAVSLDHLQEPEVLDLVAVGQANYGVVSGEQVILARSQNRDVVYVFEWFQQYPVGLVYDSALGLSDLGDLRDKAIGIPGRFGASYSGLTALLHNANLTENDIEVSEIGFNAPEVFCLGLVDAAVVYINNEPLQIQQLADAGECGAVQAVAVTSVASQVDLVSNGLIINRALLDDDAAAVQRMVGAFAEALRATIDNPAAAYIASLAHVDSLPREESFLNALESAAEAQNDYLRELPSRAEVAASRASLANQLKRRFAAHTLAQFTILLNTIELWDADLLGNSDLASWQAMHATLQRMGFLGESPVELGDAFSNQFVLAAE